VNYFFSISAALLLLGCSSVNVNNNSKHNINGLSDISQDISNYSSGVADKVTYIPYQNVYEEIYFLPWKFINAPYSLKEILWPYRIYEKGEAFAENLQFIDKQWFSTIKEYGNYGNFDTQKLYAISKRFSHLRSFATDRPLFRDPNKAGEGFPFDYLQNSAVHANEPLYLSHYSKDKKWSYVFTAYASGWLLSHDIQTIPSKYISQYKQSKLAYIIKENISIQNIDRKFLVETRIGSSFAMVKSEQLSDKTTVLISSEIGGKKYHNVNISNKVISSKKLEINSNNMNKIISEFIGQKYGWGGMYEDRDCSSTLRDIFAPFGIWLPRNSYQQSQIGKVFSFETMTKIEKEKAIKKYAVPFETLLYKKGHILLYLGTKYNSKTENIDIIVLHNMWGIRTLNGDTYGRIIIGKTVISNLEIGNKEENFDPKSDMLESLKSMNIITQ